MMKNAVRLLIILTILLADFSFSKAQNAKSQILDTAFESSKERYFSFPFKSREQLNQLTKIISIDNISESTVYAYASRDDFEKFLNTNTSYQLLDHPNALFEADMYDAALKQSYEWDQYLTYSTYVNMMYQFAADYPDICQVFSIGKTVEGRELLMAKISDNIEQKEAEPQFLYTGQIHGDETVTSILFLRLIDYLTTNYGVDDQVNNLVNNVEIWINPLANPDGLYAGGDNTINYATRYNANGVDLNRNYPDAILGDHPDSKSWQTETLHFMALAEEQNFVMSANTHAGNMVVNYPWDYWAVRHADDLWWQLVSREYADLAQLNSPAGYMENYDDGITNGYDWYQVFGGRQDYMNYFQHCREFTLELSTVKTLPSYQLPAYWDFNRQSMLNYLEQVTYGFRGRISDVDSGEPIIAKLEIEGHDFDHSYIYSDSLGYYYRPIKAGAYTLSFSAEGYDPKNVNDQSIADFDTKTIDINLKKTNTGIDSDILSQLQIINPVQNQELQIRSPLNIRQLKIYSILGQLVFEQTANASDLQIDIQHLKSGLYILDLGFSSGERIQQRIIIP